MDKDLLLKKAIAYVVKSGSAQIQDVDLTKRVVTGFYNGYNFFDGGYDVLLKGCAARSISERGPESTSIQKIKHLCDHDWTRMPGKIQVLAEKKAQGIAGIYFETKMANTTLGNDTLINYQEQVIDNHSIGMQYLDGEFIDKESADWGKYMDMLVNPEAADAAGFMYIWKEIRLFEGSNVAFGENALTPYLGVKSMNKESLAIKIGERIGLLEKQLKGGTQSDETMQSFEMQLLQLKQLVTEIFTLEPSAKDILQEKSKQARTDPEVMPSIIPAINFKSINQAFQTN